VSTPEERSSVERRRLSFGAGARAYQRFRPTFPPEAVVWGLGGRPLVVVELGAGTGLMTQVLVRTGHQVVAVEPDERMRAELHTRVGAAADVRPGSAESIPLHDGAVDAAVAAESFHWFDQPAALLEMARVVRPRGALMIVWNVPDKEAPWVRELSQVLARIDPGSDYDGGSIPEVGPWFVDVEEKAFTHVQQLTAQELVGLVGTYSYVRLSPERDQVLAEVAAWAEAHPDLAGRPTFDLPYRTRVLRSRRAVTGSA
jgi:SAM-dependent methyltransferase